MNCDICKKEYSPECDHNQGRCPHHPPLINIQPKDVSKGHFYTSLVKSGLRIVAGGMFITGSLYWGGAFLILAEVLGVVEELV